MTTSTSKPTAERNEETRSVDVSGEEYTASGPYERETVITTSDGEELVTIETWQRGYLGKLRRDHRFTENPAEPTPTASSPSPATAGPRPAARNAPSNSPRSKKLGRQSD